MGIDITKGQKVRVSFEINAPDNYSKGDLVAMIRENLNGPLSESSPVIAWNGPTLANPPDNKQ